jgi:hypothetical protein
MSGTNYYGNSYGNTKSKQVNTQKLVQDQNYSNEIFYGIMSTLESMVQHYQGGSQQYNNKMFKAYDRVNYSTKGIH